VVSVLAIGPKVRVFDPDRGRWIFKGDKNPEHHFLRRGSKYRRFTASKQNSAAISHPSLLTACQMVLAVTTGLSRTCAVSGLVTHYINAHDHRNLRKEAPMIHVGATGTNKQTNKNKNNGSVVTRKFQSIVYTCGERMEVVWTAGSSGDVWGLEPMCSMVQNIYNSSGRPTQGTWTYT
jgi:hypothetical protein